MNFIKNNLYKNDIISFSKENLPFNKLQNKSILITGASGLIGSFLIDVIMYMNQNNDLNCMVYALFRNKKNLDRFKDYINNPLFKYIIHDVNEKLVLDERVHYILHLASNTHPILYASYPISTISTNVLGTKNLLDFAVEKKTKRFLFASSVEIYGSSYHDGDLFNEEYCGYINCNTLRAGYPESKRCGEALCQAYAEEKGLDVTIARLSRIYGPTMLKNDSKAISQFILKALNKENIVLKSDGSQFFSYTYVYDAVLGILIILLNGENKNAYNISYPETDITLKEIASKIAEIAGTKVIYELPNDTEKKGFSNAIQARMDNKKIKAIGYIPKFDMSKGIKRTVDILNGVFYE